MLNFSGKYTFANVMIDSVEESCIAQIIQMINHPAFTEPMMIMPDTHSGKGSVIGFTMKLPHVQILIPNVVGVDINCGMLAFNIGNMNIDRASLDADIRMDIPFGMATHNSPVINMERDFPWDKVNRTAHEFSKAYYDDFGVEIIPPVYNMHWFHEKCKDIGANESRVVSSIGTLGGGNHFIEVGRSANTDDLWVTIHTGSRNFGKCVAEYWQKKAENILLQKRNVDLKKYIDGLKGLDSKKDFQDLIDRKKKELGIDVGVKGSGLEWLEGEYTHKYLFDMVFAQEYANTNRRYIADRIIHSLGCTVHDEIETSHNFIDFKDMIIRKGAIRAYEGERMIIPFNMRDGMLICTGKSNPDWNFSAPHGAGRVYSRSAAKRELSLEKYQKEMAEADIFSTSVGSGTLDECPDAYKDSKVIEDAIADTAHIVDRVIPIHNMKAVEEENPWKKKKKK